MRRFCERAWQVGRFDLREYFRQRIALGVILQPLFFLAAVVVLPGILANNQSNAAQRAPIVAVEGPAAPAASFVADLRQHHIRARLSPHARADTQAARCDLGVAVGTDGDVRFFVANTRDKSRNAYGAVQAALGRSLAERAGVADGGIRTTRQAIDKIPHGQQLNFSRLLPFYFVVQLLGVVGIAAGQFASTSSKRGLEPLLVLPLRRGEIAVGKAIFAAGAGLVALGALLAPLAVIATTHVSIAGIRPSLPAATFASLVAGSLCMLPFFGALGVLAGTSARTPGEAGAISALASIAPMLIALTLTFVVKGAVASWALFIPVVGQQTILSEAVRHTASAGDWALVLVASAFWAVVVLWPTGRLLRRDRMVIRPSN
ncbi:MAG TPA: ABC transporter permease subunit [Acidimicrobiales bacterium]|nr:ABC transporter permease subunit [Acidimicrobiales bacterium]